MIAEQLPEIPNQHPVSPEWLGENWALTHLAYYNLTNVTGRTLTSLTRAYRWDTIEGIPREVGGKPAMIIAKRIDGPNPRVTFAMEGMNSLSQVFRLMDAVQIGALQVGDAPTYATFNSLATAVQASLEVWGIDAVLNVHRCYQVVFTGHSLGAAMAELLAVIFKRLYPQHDVQLVKFGSPKIGVERWRRMLEQSVPNASFYAHRDPIYLLPTFSPARVPAELAIWRFGPGLLVGDRNPWTVDESGRVAPEPFNEDFTSAVTIAQRVVQPMGVDNPWYWHLRNAYRYVITQMCNARQGVETARFRHVEMPDENSWGAAYLPGGGITEDMLAVAAPPPADFLTGFVDLDGTLTGEHNLDAPTILSTSNPALQIEGRGSFAPRPRHRMHVRP